MSIQYPRLNRGGVNPVGATRNHIYRDPPKSITTRKYEPVNVADVMFMAQADNPNGDPTRINEAIKVYARGKNPMVEVDYGAGQGVKNPYRIEVVRPPLMPIETLQPISAPRIHQNYTITSNPGIAPISVGDKIDHNAIKNITATDKANGVVRVNPSQTYWQWYDNLGQDSVQSKRITLQGSIRPTASYSLELTRGMTQLRPNAVGEVNTYSVNSGIVLSGGDNRPQNITLNAIKDVNQMGAAANLSFGDIAGLQSQSTVSLNAIKDINAIGIGSNPNFTNIVIVDPKTNASLDVNSTIQEKNYIALNAALGKPLHLDTGTGQQIVLKDYKYTPVTSNIGNSQLVIQVAQPDVQLERNTPLFAATTNVGLPGYNEDLARATQGQQQLDRMANFGSWEDRVSRPIYSRQDMPLNSTMAGEKREKIFVK